MCGWNITSITIDNNGAMFHRHGNLCCPKNQKAQIGASKWLHREFDLIRVLGLCILQ